MKKFILEVQEIVLGEDDLQNNSEVEEIIKNLGMFEGVEQISEDIFKIVFHQLPQKDDESVYYWIKVKVKEEKGGL